MVKHWEENGLPVYMAVSGYLGLIKKKSGGTSGRSPLGGSGGKEYGDLEELSRMFADTGGLIQ